ncbi:TOMM precursor leader peptide-binding protein [Paenibacillus chondroitinus]|uniref:TOMM leader peptide-binding protein n=1 Tax=Paenibacillus chondroitinus TaxID=59842 RepID=A0ABU6DCX2_9BACL|nr:MULTISPECIES: TOMM precursor leader peptide-binding protein [Paenibacillus]MCY9656507.1 TOMM precursor leader peptide-binding protein [Paenibacillus anseongense]MEB4795331.1 TOMM precursor leader peptide-binding protein [Paenibacillus chondroitinus]
MHAILSVVGEGLLADCVYGELLDRYEVVRQPDFTSDIPKAAKMAVVLHDDWPSSGYFEAEEVLQQAGIPWLRGFLSRDEGIVGPLVRPSMPGCSQCADNRRFTASPGDMQHVSSSPSGIRQTAHLLIAEIERVLQGSPAHTEQHMYIVNLLTLNNSLHFILPDPLCEVCGSLPDDSSAASNISLKPRLKTSADSYRSRPMDDLKLHLAKDYLDSRTGVFNAKMLDLESPFAGVGVNLPSFLMGDEITGGRSFSYAESALTAILEGLERLCGITPRGKRTVIYECFNHIADQALDPFTVGLYSKKQYALPDFTFEPFDPDLPIDWVWGYSLVRDCPILVPESLAYYSSGFGGGFVQEGSNGCALGGSLEEAILHGILEVAERDSFLMTWYAQLPIPRLDPYSAHDQELLLMLERLRAVAGYDVHLFNMTMENGIPSIWALAKSITPGKMNLICAAGAHLDPVRAAKSAIHELAGRLLFLQERFEANLAHVKQMLDDPYLVLQMEDHALLYGLPQAEDRLRFLLDGQRPLRTFNEEFKRKASHADLTDDLKDMIEVFRRLNLDVIVVDQSSPEILRNGLHCVKVLIPGMLPMTFGHHLQRLTGLKRVLQVPVELGYAKKPLKIRQLNPHPHPFL